MVYGYKITDGNIQPMGASDSLERLTKALTVAGISTEGMQTQTTELVMAKGKYYLSETDEEYIVAKAEEQAERERIANLPTEQDKLEAQVMYTAMLTDTLLEEE